MFYDNNPSLIPSLLLVEVGDWSRDGHNESTVYPLHWEGLHPGDNAQKMFENFLDVGAKKMGVDLREEICSDYEDDKLPVKKIQPLYDAIMDLRINVSLLAPFKRMGLEFIDSVLQKDGGVADAKDYVFLIYLQACVGAGVALPITLIDRSSSKIGGYGLFSVG
jgi:hypothetical protein